MSQQRVIVKKVKAFPFPVQFKSASFSFSGQIGKMTTLGFIAEVSKTDLQPLEKLECAFTFPLSEVSVAEKVVVVKIHNQWAGSIGGAKSQDSTSQASAKTPGVLHLVEMHFVELSRAGKTHIDSFLRSLKKQGV